MSVLQGNKIICCDKETQIDFLWRYCNIKCFNNRLLKKEIKIYGSCYLRFKDRNCHGFGSKNYYEKKFDFIKIIPFSKLFNNFIEVVE